MCAASSAIGFTHADGVAAFGAPVELAPGLQGGPLVGIALHPAAGAAVGEDIVVGFTNGPAEGVHGELIGDVDGGCWRVGRDQLIGNVEDYCAGHIAEGAEDLVGMLCVPLFMQLDQLVEL